MVASVFNLSVLVALAATVQHVVATPPACLLACVAEVAKGSTCSGLDDLSCICSSQNSKVEECLKNRCPGNDASTAKSSFQDSCSGHMNSSSSSNSASSTTLSPGSAVSNSTGGLKSTTSSPESKLTSSTGDAPLSSSSSPLVSSAPVALSSSGVMGSASLRSTAATSEEGSGSVSSQVSLAVVTSKAGSSAVVASTVEVKSHSNGAADGHLSSGLAVLGFAICALI